MMNVDESKFGVGDYSYQMAGEISGLTKLVNLFYDNMESLPEAQVIRSMHPSDLSSARQKLAYFLSGWLGGPKLYSENYGPINIPGAHRHLSVGVEERDAWMLCMAKAVELQPYDEAFKKYLIAQLSVPAERIRVACSR